MGLRDVRIYLAGLTASEVGSTAMTLVAGIWVKELTGSNRSAALVSACVYLPTLLSPLAGLLADRVPRRRLLLAVNLVAALGVLPLLLVDAPSRAWIVLVVMTGHGAAVVLIDPAEVALFTELVPPDRRGAVNGVRLSLTEGSKLLAPLAGAGLFAVVGGPAVAVADAVTFLLAALAVRLVRVPAAPSRAAPTGRWLREVTAGWRHVRRTAGLWPLALAGGAAMALSGLPVAAPYALLDALHRPPSFLGVLTGVLGAGSVVAGLASGRVLRRTGERGLVLIALADGVGGYLLVATGELGPVLAGRFLLGLFLPWVLVAVVTAGQRLTPDHLQGRTASTLMLMLFAPVPLAQVVGAVALAGLDYRTAYLLTALAVAVVGAALAVGRHPVTDDVTVP